VQHDRSLCRDHFSRDSLFDLWQLRQQRRWCVTRHIASDARLPLCRGLLVDARRVVKLAESRGTTHDPERTRHGSRLPGHHLTTKLEPMPDWLAQKQSKNQSQIGWIFVFSRVLLD
jgi:hypothetical protein